MDSNKVIDALLGVAVGDAIGVPFEFKSHTEMALNPATKMIGYGTHNQPIGTWSDDSSLTFCLAESLTKGYDLTDIASKFIAWKDNNYWTARGKLFDIGKTTYKSIEELKEILDDEDFDELKKLNLYPNENHNGNGSLMRIIPLLFYIKGLNIKEQFRIVWEISALTHSHIRAAMSCLIYLKLSENILSQVSKEEAYLKTRNEILKFWEEIDFDIREREHFKRIIQNDIQNTKREDLKSGGYVIETIEASLWCFLKETSFEKSIFSVINLGHDTDTTAAVTGGLAGLYYGTEKIPEHWVASLARMEDIIELGNRLNDKYSI